MNTSLDKTATGARYANGAAPGMTIRNLQALRAIAACAVLLIHLLSVDKGLSDGLNAFAAEYWWYGPAGVDLFFVISGFIVSFTASRIAEKALNGRQAAFEFFSKRVVRIYPVYWIVLALAFAVGGTLELSPAWLPRSSTLQLLTLTTTVNYKVMLAWTLCYEMMFYTFLAMILLVSGSRFPKALAAWCTIHAAVIIARMILVPDIHGKDILLSPMILEFYLGCAIFYLYRRGIHQQPFFALLLGVFSFYIGSYGNRVLGGWTETGRTLAFGVPSALLVYAFISFEKVGVVLPRWLQRIGDASYSIYIWHQLVLAALGYVFKATDLNLRLRLPVVLSIWLAVVFLVGFASYHFIEKPTMRFMKSVLSRRGVKKDAADPVRVS